MDNNEPDGFEVPVYQALLRPRLVLGAPRLFSIGLIVGTAVALVWHAWPFLPFAVLLQVFAAWGTRQDPDWFAIVLRCYGYKKYYEV